MFVNLDINLTKSWYFPFFLCLSSDITAAGEKKNRRTKTKKKKWRQSVIENSCGFRLIYLNKKKRRNPSFYTSLCHTSFYLDFFFIRKKLNYDFFKEIPLPSNIIALKSFREINSSKRKKKFLLNKQDGVGYDFINRIYIPKLFIGKLVLSYLLI